MYKYGLKVFGLSGIAITATALLMVYPVFQSDVRQPESAEPISIEKKPSRQWELCWKEEGKYRKAMNVKQECLDAVVEKRTISDITVIFSYPAGIGVMEGASKDGVNYYGGWRNCDKRGKWHLRFVESERAYGWSLEEGGGNKH